MNIYQPSFFDEAERLIKLTKLKDPLEALKQHIDFEIFRPQLEAVFSKDKKSAAGRKAYDVVLMFKILILQRLYNLSDEQAEFQINDRQSFQRFLGMHLGSTVPDFSTVWLFREALTVAEVIKPLFDTGFRGVLCLFLLDMGLIAARRLMQSRKMNLRLVSLAIVIPLLNGAIGAIVGTLVGLDVASAAALGILAASASYIAVPAAMRLALPKADPGIYLSMSLGVTFPFNIIFGISIFAAFAKAIG